MAELVEAACDAVAARVDTGRPLLWRLERRRLQRELAEVLERDEAVRAELGVVPVGAEVGFGTPGGPGPVVVEVGAGRTVALRGRIDRVDASTDGSRVVVTDYKTGVSLPKRPEADLASGRHLQLAVYALAARAGAVPATSPDPAGAVEAVFWQVNEVVGSRRLPTVVDAGALAALTAAVATIAEGIEAGVFPADPGGADYRGHAHCGTCPYDALCPSERQARWEAKRADPAVGGYRRLADARP